MQSRQAVVDLITGRWRSQILYAGVKLGVFDALAGGARNAQALAQELFLDPVMSYRLLRGLACIGVLREEPDRLFSLTAEGEFLRKDHPQSLRGMTRRGPFARLRSVSVADGSLGSAAR